MEEKILTTILERIEVMQSQMATKDDLKGMATKKDLQDVRYEMATRKDLEEIGSEMATKDDIKSIRSEMATKEDLKWMATKEDLENVRSEMATKDDLKGMATKEDLKGMATKEDLEESNKNILDIVTFIQETAITHEEFEEKFENHKNEIISHIDSFIVITQKLDVELIAMRSKYERLESQLQQVAQHLNIQFTS